MAIRKHRIHYSLDPGVVRLFQLMCPHGKRSRVLERLMSQWCVANYDKVKDARSTAGDKLANRVTILGQVHDEIEQRDQVIFKEAAERVVGEEGPQTK